MYTALSSYSPPSWQGNPENWSIKLYSMFDEWYFPSSIIEDVSVGASPAYLMSGGLLSQTAGQSWFTFIPDIILGRMEGWEGCISILVNLCWSVWLERERCDVYYWWRWSWLTFLVSPCLTVVLTTLRLTPPTLLNLTRCQTINCNFNPLDAGYPTVCMKCSDISCHFLFYINKISNLYWFFSDLSFFLA